MIGGRGPMAVVEFHFVEKLPSQFDVERRLEETLGRGLLSAIDSVECDVATDLDGVSVIRVCSQDFVALTYVRRVLSELGGSRIQPGTGREMDLKLPDWVQTTWLEHGWFSRLKIRFGPLAL